METLMRLISFLPNPARNHQTNSRCHFQLGAVFGMMTYGSNIYQERSVFYVCLSVPSPRAFFGNLVFFFSFLSKLLLVVVAEAVAAEAAAAIIVINSTMIFPHGNSIGGLGVFC